MVLPRLIHPVPVTIERLQTSETIYDVDAREPVKQGYRKQSFDLYAQISWGTHDGEQPTRLGAQDEEQGYILFRRVDLLNASPTPYHPQRNDRIVTIGTLPDLKLYIVSVQPMGHYPDQGGYSLWKCRFVDRAPVVSGD